ncbi:MAG: RNA polymerase factor sigma-54 [Candidatus Omnitrophica bacterium]|nr:RNA polymerase factor sigma-54 [Candidatus Omnitrophota bacterium]
MALQAKQTTQQRLMLAPNVTLALEVLHMPLLELQAFLEQQCEENPLLEIEESQNDEAAASAEEPQTNGTEEAPTNGLDEDWMSHWQLAGESEDPTDEDERRDRMMDQRLVTPQSLHESLQLQLGCQSMADEERRLGELLITRLDENGYLDSPLEELSTAAGATPAQLEAVLTIIQQFDPPGVGARDLRECLMIQLEQEGATESLAYRILKDHFPLFAERRLSALAKVTRSSLEQVTHALEALKALNPRPGRIFSGDVSPSVVPDLVVHHREKHYDVELNDHHMPRVTVSRTYYRMLKDPATPDDAKEFLAQKFRKASWLIKAIDERNATLLSIGRCLISLQRDFLEQGSKAITPLTQAQVAHLIGRHPSTVSRAIAGKTIDTPYGIYRLEQLFASNVPQHADNGAISDEKIKAEMQRLIGEEDPHAPLSDEALVKEMAQRSIIVARRTVAKYRTALKILPAHLRKHRL